MVFLSHNQTHQSSEVNWKHCPNQEKITSSLTTGLQRKGAFLHLYQLFVNAQTWLTNYTMKRAISHASMSSVCICSDLLSANETWSLMGSRTHWHGEAGRNETLQIHWQTSATVHQLLSVWWKNQYNAVHCTHTTKTRPREYCRHRTDHQKHT